MPKETQEDIRNALLEAGYSPRTVTKALGQGSSVKDCLKWCWTNIGIRFGTLRQGRFKNVVDELEHECEHLILQSEKVVLRQNNELPNANVVDAQAEADAKADQEGRKKVLKSVAICFCIQLLAVGVVAAIMFIPGEWRFCGVCKGRAGTLHYAPHHCEFKPCKPGQLDSNLYIFFMLWGINMVLIIGMALAGFFCSHGRCMAFLQVSTDAQGVWTIVLLTILGLMYGMLYSAGPDNLCRTPIELPHMETAVPYPCEQTRMDWIDWTIVVVCLTITSCGVCIACGMSMRAFVAFLGHEEDK
jgi:hypothetical protein